MGQNFVNDLLIFNTGDYFDGTSTMGAGFNRAAFGSMLNTLFNLWAQVIAMNGMYAGFAGAKNRS